MCPNWAAGRVQQCLPRHNVCGLSVHALHCDLCSSLQLRLHRLLRRLGRRHDRLATACGAAGGLQQPLPGCYLRRSAAPPVSNRLPIALPLPTDARCRCRLTADFHHVEDGSQYAYSCQEFITSLNCECTGCCAAPPSPPPAPAPPPPSPVPVACQKVCHDETCLSFRSTPCAILEAPPWSCDCSGCCLSDQLPPPPPPSPVASPPLPAACATPCAGSTCGAFYPYACSDFVSVLGCSCDGCCLTAAQLPSPPHAPPPSPAPRACDRMCHGQTCLAFQSTPCASWSHVPPGRSWSTASRLFPRPTPQLLIHERRFGTSEAP